MVDEIKLRLAISADLCFLYNLKKQTLRQHIDNLWGWNEDFQQKYFLNRLKSRIISVVLLGTKKIGCFILRTFRNWIVVELIVIAPEFQSKGVGTSLIKSVISQSQRENKSLCLHVLKTNERAKKLYLRLGFVQISESVTGFNMQYIN